MTAAVICDVGVSRSNRSHRTIRKSVYMFVVGMLNVDVRRTNRSLLFYNRYQHPVHTAASSHTANYVCVASAKQRAQMPRSGVAFARKTYSRTERAWLYVERQV